MRRLSHLIPAILLIFSAGSTLQQDPRGAALAIALIEGGACLWFIASVARGIRYARTHESVPFGHGIDWADVIVAALFVADGLERRYVRGEGSLLQPVFIMAAGMLVLGLLQGRIWRIVQS